ncbi:LTA synthase family protein [Adlercreutzia sp. ZJ141]|uniref:LTA synthase family protein n=1 Tax=Adlercreutzia sp. ZJ141 TaxID=2709406 RepID=UPI0013EAE8D4|nr:LTA synthase family protein [Adlercreutzia sp. ZJ141]
MPDKTTLAETACPARTVDAASCDAAEPGCATDSPIKPSQWFSHQWKKACTWSKAACAGFVAAAVILALAALAGFLNVPVPATLASCTLFGFLGVLCLTRDARSAAPLSRWKHFRPIAAVLAVPIGFYLIERPYNDRFPFMEAQGVLVSLAILAVAFTVLFVLLQRSRAAIALFLGSCLFIGIANYFVTLFKGQPILPSDVMAFSTALTVSSGYSYTLGWPLLESICVFAACLAALAYVPKVKASFGGALASVLVAASIVGGAYTAFEHLDFEEDFGVQIDVWNATDAYQSKGSAACFMKQMQDLVPKAPDGYSPPNADALLTQQSTALSIESAPDNTALAPALAYADQLEPDLAAKQAMSPAVATDGAEVTGVAGVAGEGAPTVIAIMNESFSDLSSFPTLEASEAKPELYYQLAQGAIESGYTYVSAKGGGTCNSEFEFLTCSTNGFLGAGAYPYVQYNLEGTESLVSYFSNLGYATHAIHPNEATNWRRDRIYQQLGFDSFTSIESFEGAETLRDMVADKETYNVILEMLEANTQPQFIFDVTMQNHGGYEKGVPHDVSLNVDTPSGTTAPELSEYASVVRQSQLDLLDFLEALELTERPIVLCFFGDHQPGFTEALWEETHDGQRIGSADLETLQECWNTPYMIWANASARSKLDHQIEPTDFVELQRTLGRNAVQDNEEESSEEYAFEDSVDNNTEGEGDETSENTSEERSDEPYEPTLPEGETHTNRISLNYLGVRLLGAAGLPLTPYQSCLAETSQLIPAINLNGYLLADGTWHRFNGEGSESEFAATAEERLQNLRILQYDNLFNRGLIRSNLWYTLQ